MPRGQRRGAVATCAGTSHGLVLDINMPGESGLDAIPRVNEASPDTSGHADHAGRPAFAREALQSGALGFVLKEAADEQLVEAVRLAADGETYLKPGWAPACPPGRRPGRRTT